MLTRIYGTAFLDKAALEEHLKRLEEARARDHRKLGRELGLFMLSDVAPGMPFWLPKGTHVWNELTRLWRTSNVERGYTEVRTPILYDVELWKKSGHWHVYRDHMYFTDVEGQPMGLKPMNCPAHVQIYKRDARSYRDLPIRYAEQGLVHRHEPSGTLHGLLRVRHITQDDAHVFCTEEQIEEEVLRCLDFGFFIYDQFGFKPRLELSTRPEKRVGTEEMWDKAEDALQGALESRGLEYDLNEGDGAFYGPKIDLHMTDTIGRSWQLGTVQLDYYMPEQFELTYTGADNAEHRPAMIHRALDGLVRALHRHPDRALRRRAAALAGARPGDRAPDRGPARALRAPRGHRPRAGAGSGPRWTIAPSPWAARSATRSCRRCPTCWWWATRRRTTGKVAVRRHREGDLGRHVGDRARRSAERRDRAPRLDPPLYSPRMKGTHFSRIGSR